MAKCILRMSLVLLLGLVRLPVAVFAGGCSPTGSNCNATRCCTDEGMRCYEKALGWATCKSWCDPGVDHNEPVEYRTSWSCAVVGVPAGSSTQKGCTAAGQDCRGTGCCKQDGHTCFQRDEAWATCRQECTVGVDQRDAVKVPWTCAVVGIPAWGGLASHCAKAGEDCRQSGCCSQSGFQCYQKNNNWATCRETCSPGIDVYEAKAYQTPWNCAPYIRPTGVSRQCSAFNDDCRSTGCCLNEGMQCYEKNGKWATCKSSCKAGIDPNDEPGHQSPWSCNVVNEIIAAPRSMGMDEAYGKNVGYKSGSSGLFSQSHIAWTTSTKTTTTLNSGWWKFKQIGGLHFLKKNVQEPIEVQRTEWDHIATRSINVNCFLAVVGGLIAFATFSCRRYTHHRYSRPRTSIADSGEEVVDSGLMENLQDLLEQDGTCQ